MVFSRGAPAARPQGGALFPHFLRSAIAPERSTPRFKRMGDMVLEDMDLMDRGLPPMRGKRAERETVSRMRSRPVSRN